MLPRTAHEWSTAVQRSPWFAARRSDSARRLRVLLTVLGRHADWDDHTTWPTWERLLDATGWGRSTMSSWLAELQRLGWLLRIEHGSTSQFRPMALSAIEGNRAAVYQLRIPVDPTSPAGLDLALTAKTALTDQTEQTQTRTPTTPLRSSISRNHVVPTRASGNFHNFAGRAPVEYKKDGPAGPRLDEHQVRVFDLRVPTGPAQMLAAASELRAGDRALRRLSPRWVRTLMRPWWSAGWTNRDLFHALDHAPTTGGTRTSLRCPAAQLRSPDGWVKHRLSRWLDDTGHPMTPPGTWATIQHEIAAAHGAAAATRLRYGAHTLQPSDLAISAAEHQAAAAALVRRWASEFQDARRALTPLDQVADSEHREATVAQWRDERAARRRRAPAPEPTAAPVPAAATPDEQDTAPQEPASAPSSQEIHERALRLARASGRVPLRRRGRRRNPW